MNHSETANRTNLTNERIDIGVNRTYSGFSAERISGKNFTWGEEAGTDPETTTYVMSDR